MCNFRLLYKDLPPIEIKIHKSEKLTSVKEKGIELFQLQSISPKNIRLREYNYYFAFPTDPISDEKLQISCGDYIMYVTSPKHIYIETKEDNEEFPKFSRMDIVVKVSAYDPVSNSWSNFSNFYFSRNTRIRNVRELFFC
jgi:hypothetical protein